MKIKESNLEGLQRLSREDEDSLIEMSVDGGKYGINSSLAITPLVSLGDRGDWWPTPMGRLLSSALLERDFLKQENDIVDIVQERNRFRNLCRFIETILRSPNHVPPEKISRALKELESGLAKK